MWCKQPFIAYLFDAHRTRVLGGLRLGHVKQQLGPLQEVVRLPVQLDSLKRFLNSFKR